MRITNSTTPTWCPGCPNFMILFGIKNAILKSKKTEDELAIVTGIGCHGKIYDYLNLKGINTLHGRVLPTCLGLKVGNPNLTIFAFSGDGDAYAEGMEHTVHAARYNVDCNYFVHNNNVFALTLGQPTPTTEKNYEDKTTPNGVKLPPINPMKLMLSAGASFVARVYADAKQVEWVANEAMKHKGFSFIEIIQPCIIFHPKTLEYEKPTYMLEETKHDKTNFAQAWARAEEFDYNTLKKVPLGVFYQVERPTFESQIPQLANLKKEKKSWKDIER